MMKNNKITWHTEKRKVCGLKGFENNPRQMTEKQYNDLKESFKKFNYAEIVVINTDNMIIAGHQRIKVLIDLKREKELIEVRVPNRKLTKKEFKEYMIRSNKNVGGWDSELLSEFFTANELRDWGFTEDELKFTTEEIEIKEKEVDENISTESQCPKCGYKW